MRIGGVRVSAFYVRMLAQIVEEESIHETVQAQGL